MLENVSKLGVDGFFTYHFAEGNSFRPCATRMTQKDAIEATVNEFMEIKYILKERFPSVIFGGRLLGKFKLPIHLHPFIWQKRTIQDVNWYNQKYVNYVPFYNYKNGSLRYLPEALSIYSNEKECGLTFSSQEGYSYDQDIEHAKLKAVMELIEKIL